MLKNERQYIRQVLDYEAQYEAQDRGDYSYPPIVPKLLLSIFIRLGDLLIVSSVRLGLILACLFVLIKAIHSA